MLVTVLYVIQAFILVGAWGVSGCWPLSPPTSSLHSHDLIGGVVKHLEMKRPLRFLCFVLVTLVNPLTPTLSGWKLKSEGLSDYSWPDLFFQGFKDWHIPFQNDHLNSTLISLANLSELLIVKQHLLIRAYTHTSTNLLSTKNTWYLFWNGIAGFCYYLRVSEEAESGACYDDSPKSSKHHSYWLPPLKPDKLIEIQGNCPPGQLETRLSEASSVDYICYVSAFPLFPFMPEALEVVFENCFCPANQIWCN